MQNNVTMSTSEEVLDVKYGMYGLRDEREQARGSLKYILCDITDIKRSYFRLGFHLHEFKNCKYYEDFGFLTFEEFCEANFDMDKGAISRCINVFLMINAHGEERHSAGCKTIGCSMEISDKYKDYSYSQLCEMLPLDEEKRSKVKPDMTVKEIRELKKKIVDITPEQVKDFVEYFRNEVSAFTRDDLIQIFIKNGSIYHGHGGDVIDFDFKPGKVRIHYSEYYSFAKILDYYEECGGEFEEVATSQPKEITILYGSFKDDIFIADMLGRCKKFAESTNMEVINPTISGKRLSFEDSHGNTYMVQYSVSKKKED